MNRRAVDGARSRQPPSPNGCVTSLSRSVRVDGTSLHRNDMRLYTPATYGHGARGVVEPGSEAQIAYCRLDMWDDPISGRRLAVCVFAMILSCSRAFPDRRSRL